ncbi:lysozyme inhibitor LprI family protein [Pseudooceanicola atlanticus]|uniref:Lysozyme inhibitor LprI-like N-terminal domain-containing protein n=1 Tax=Pseudooceanicola atlanticus TaxID=1461694 RepID=A0A0A0EID4_9RHOB|nr:lysozyme inhibitor LprI family protein [Pseudooceanicola atlanticus]KGM48912.1 hypothetical protein ATO9_09405 [Pseudooceanicola atlanticus]
MTPTKVAALLTFLATPFAGHAQDGPAFDCAKAESSAEKLVCDDPALAALDRRLADRFAAAMSVAKGLDAGANEAEDLLRATQRGWIKGRDECWKDPDLRVCVERQYLQREGQLVAQFMLEDPRETQEWFCGDNARSVTITTFDTELPAIRVEEGDSVYVGSLRSVDTPGDYFVAFWGAISFDGTTARIEDNYGEKAGCRIAG